MKNILLDLEGYNQMTQSENTAILNDKLNIITVTFIITGIYTMYLSTVNNMYQDVHKKCANPINATALGMHRKHIE